MLAKCDPKGPLCVQVLKLIYNEYGNNFYSLGRIISGTLKKGAMLRVMGEGYTLEEEEDCLLKEAERLWLPQARYKIEVDHLSAGNWVLIQGIDQSITKTATLISADSPDTLDIFKPIDFSTEAVLKVACEPLNPSELPKMLEGLRMLSKSYPLCTTRVEESGEHVVLGTGELYLDSLFSDLRTQYACIELKVSEPFPAFAESVAD